jgi:FAD/FMN-containing dehydrogenase
MTAAPTTDGRVHTTEAVAELATAIRGEVIQPGDHDYDSARALWNAAHDKRPRIIVKTAGPADVVAAVRYARAHDLEIAVRGGGHSIAGFSGVDDGLVIDLSPMNAVIVDAGTRRAIVQGGATWADVDAETQLYGLATTGGLVSSTGVGGFTLGGGIGWLMRTYGLATDNMVAADVVTANGETVRASATENADLLWALRGGGGNFGVVTSFEFAVHPVGPTVAGGAIFYPGDIAGEVTRDWRDWLPTAPNELTTIVNLLTAPPAPFIPEEWHGKRLVAIIGMHAGQVDSGLRSLAPLRDFGEPVADLLGPIPYVAMQQLFDPLVPAGDGAYFKAHHLNELPDSAIEALASAHRSSTSPMNEIHVHDLRGAVARAPKGGSAFPHRSAQFVLNVIARWPGAGNGPEHVAWAREAIESLEQYGDGTAYVNYLGDAESDARLRTVYGPDNYDRLVAVKTHWDPDNVFHLNQNIRPR